MKTSTSKFLMLSQVRNKTPPSAVTTTDIRLQGTAHIRCWHTWMPLRLFQSTRLGLHWSPAAMIAPSGSGIWQDRGRVFRKLQVIEKRLAKVFLTWISIHLFQSWSALGPMALLNSTLHHKQRGSSNLLAFAYRLVTYLGRELFCIDHCCYPCLPPSSLMNVMLILRFHCSNNTAFRITYLDSGGL
jgi:hypothetical protein